MVLIFFLFHFGNLTFFATLSLSSIIFLLLAILELSAFFSAAFCYFLLVFLFASASFLIFFFAIFCSIFLFFFFFLFLLSSIYIYIYYIHTAYITLLSASLYIYLYFSISSYYSFYSSHFRFTISSFRSFQTLISYLHFYLHIWFCFTISLVLYLLNHIIYRYYYI